MAPTPRLPSSPSNPLVILIVEAGAEARQQMRSGLPEGTVSIEAATLTAAEDFIAQTRFWIAGVILDGYVPAVWGGHADLSIKLITQLRSAGHKCPIVASSSDQAVRLLSVNSDPTGNTHDSRGKSRAVMVLVNLLADQLGDQPTASI